MCAIICIQCLCTLKKQQNSVKVNNGHEIPLVETHIFASPNSGSHGGFEEVSDMRWKWLLNFVRFLFGWFFQWNLNLEVNWCIDQKGKSFRDRQFSVGFIYDAMHEIRIDLIFTDELS